MVSVLIGAHGAPQVHASAPIDAALSLQHFPEAVALHLIRYDYDRASDRVPALGEVTLDVELDERHLSVAGFGAPLPPEVALEHREGRHSVRLRDVPLYSIVLFVQGDVPGGTPAYAHRHARARSDEPPMQA